MLESLKKLGLPALALGLFCLTGSGCVDHSGDKTYPRGDAGNDAGADDVPGDDAPAGDAPATDTPDDTSSGDTAADLEATSDGSTSDALTVDVRLDVGAGG
jgi:hypothetical protein